MKKCSKCGETKPEGQFSRRSRNQESLSSWCKQCVRLSAAASVQKNRELNKSRDLYADHHKLKKCCGCLRELPLSNFGPLCTTKDGLNGYCEECHRSRCSEYSAKNARRVLFLAAKSRAKQGCIPFNIDLSDIDIPDVCPVLGFKFGDTKETRPSLDKIIPSLGYTKGNVVVVSMRANRIKSDATAEELEQIANFYKKLAK